MVNTRNLYTKNSKTANFSSVASESHLAQVEWEPGTHEAMCSFPDGPKGTLGYYLYLVQKGEIPPDYGPVPGIPNVFELRDSDERAWYRVIHLKKVNGKIHVLHCFEKQSNQIEKRDIRTIEGRLGKLNQRLAEEKRNAKRERKTQEGDKRKRP